MEYKRLYTKLAKRISELENKQKAKKRSQFIKSGVSGQYIMNDRAIDTDLELANTSGCIVLEQGFMIQWGRVYHDADGTTTPQPQSYIFKKRFPNTCFGVICNMQRTGVLSANASEITRSGFEIDSSDDLSSERYINYIAIGF